MADASVNDKPYLSIIDMKDVLYPTNFYDVHGLINENVGIIRECLIDIYARLGIEINISEFKFSYSFYLNKYSTTDKRLLGALDSSVKRGTFYSQDIEEDIIPLIPTMDLRMVSIMYTYSTPKLVKVSNVLDDYEFIYDCSANTGYFDVKATYDNEGTSFSGASKSVDYRYYYKVDKSFNVLDELFTGLQVPIDSSTMMTYTSTVNDLNIECDFSDRVNLIVRSKNEIMNPDLNASMINVKFEKFYESTAIYIVAYCMEGETEKFIQEELYKDNVKIKDNATITVGEGDYTMVKLYSLFTKICLMDTIDINGFIYERDLSGFKNKFTGGLESIPLVPGKTEIKIPFNKVVINLDPSTIESIYGLMRIGQRVFLGRVGDYISTLKAALPDLALEGIYFNGSPTSDGEKLIMLVYNYILGEGYFTQDTTNTEKLDRIKEHQSVSGELLETREAVLDVNTGGGEELSYSVTNGYMESLLSVDNSVLRDNGQESNTVNIRKATEANDLGVLLKTFTAANGPWKTNFPILSKNREESFVYIPDIHRTLKIMRVLFKLDLSNSTGAMFNFGENIKSKIWSSTDAFVNNNRQFGVNAMYNLATTEGTYNTIRTKIEYKYKTVEGTVNYNTGRAFLVGEYSIQDNAAQDNIEYLSETNAVFLVNYLNELQPV